jgi:hypothetical protein
VVPGVGTYYIRLFGESSGNKYDLWWDSLRLPVVDITVNGTNGPVTVPRDSHILVDISLDPASHADDGADWWVLIETPLESRWYYFRAKTREWRPGFETTHRGPLIDLSGYNVLDRVGLPPGDYSFYFGFDLEKNGLFDNAPAILYYDRADLTVLP